MVQETGVQNEMCDGACSSDHAGLQCASVSLVGLQAPRGRELGLCLMVQPSVSQPFLSSSFPSMKSQCKAAWYAHLGFTYENSIFRKNQFSPTCW